MSEFITKGEEVLKKRWNNSQTAENYFDKRFEHPVWNFMHRKESAIVNLFILKLKPEKILDFATGPARVAKELKNFKNGWAIDYSEEMLKVAQKELLGKGSNWQIEKQDAFSLSFPSAFFDIVVSFRFLRHFEAKDRKRLYWEVNRVLKNGGLFIFEALNKGMSSFLFRPQFTGAADKSLYDELYTPEELEKELKQNGFSLVKLFPNVCHGKFYFYLSKILGRQTKLLFWIFSLLERIGLSKCFQWEVVAKKESF